MILGIARDVVVIIDMISLGISAVDARGIGSGASIEARGFIGDAARARVMGIRFSILFSFHCYFFYA